MSTGLIIKREEDLHDDHLDVNITNESSTNSISDSSESEIIERQHNTHTLSNGQMGYMKHYQEEHDNDQEANEHEQEAEEFDDQDIDDEYEENDELEEEDLVSNVQKSLIAANHAKLPNINDLYQQNCLAAAQMMQLMCSTASSSSSSCNQSDTSPNPNNSNGSNPVANATENEKENIPICKYCNKIFANFSNLNHHISAIHLNQSKWVCSQCGKVNLTHI
jgi:hypothetical protein